MVAYLCNSFTLRTPSIDQRDKVMRQLVLSFFALVAIGAAPQISIAQVASQQSNLAILIGQYQSGTDLVRPNIARQINRAVKQVEKTPETALIRAQALIALSQQAAKERRKDFALKSAQEAMALGAALSGPDGRAVRARASISASHALILKEEFQVAARTMVAARRSYGPLVIENDVVWDELLLWASITEASAPERLKDQIDSESLPNEEALSLLGQRGILCAGQGLGLKRKRNEGREPVYPVNSLYSGLQGGVVMRSNIDPDGRILSTRATAFAPADGFAAAAENAVPTWVYEMPTNLPASCRDNVLNVLMFKIG
jgi:Gram-negative bacterial TonB protein C-terminal